MSITDELMKEARGFGRYAYTAPQADCLTAIADRIEAELADMQAFCDRLREAAESREDVTLFGVDYVALPLDADGVPIHVGDVMWQKGRITKRACKAIMGDAYVMLDGIQGAVYAKGLTHYHEPTVEDVLRDFAQEMNENMGMYTGEAIDADEWRDADAKTVEKFAAKLQLRKAVGHE